MVDVRKKCSRCGEVKLFGEFHLDRRPSHRRQSRCKVCSCELRRKWREANGQKPETKAAAAERTRQWRLKNPERARETSKAWKAANQERVLKYRARYYRLQSNQPTT